MRTKFRLASFSGDRGVLEWEKARARKSRWFSAINAGGDLDGELANAATTDRKIADDTYRRFSRESESRVRPLSLSALRNVSHIWNNMMRRKNLSLARHHQLRPSFSAELLRGVFRHDRETIPREYWERERESEKASFFDATLSLLLPFFLVLYYSIWPSSLSFAKLSTDDKFLTFSLVIRVQRTGYRD